MLTTKGMALRMNNEILVLWPRLHSLLLTNQIEFLDMFWWFDGRIKSVLWSRNKWPACGNGFCARWSRKSEREQKRGMKELSLIWKRLLGRLKHRLLKLFEYLCTLNTLPTRVQSLDRLNWEIKSPLAQRSEQKSHAKGKRRHYIPISHSLFYSREDALMFSSLLSKIVHVW